VSKRRLRQLESIHLAREQRDAGKQELAFHARPFVLCGLPLRRPQPGQLTHTRRNGKFFLQIAAHPEFGLPFGQDRLIPIWVATLAVQQKSRIVRFDTALQMLDFFRLAPDGRHYRRVVQGFQRIFAATIFFGTHDHPDANRLVDSSRFHFFDHLHLWFTPDHTERPAAEDYAGNTITLSEAFYDEINQHRIPVERHAVAAFAHAPGLLDFDVWLVWKCWSARQHGALVPLFSDGGLVNQLGTDEYSRERFFRRKINFWLRQVKVLWPESSARVSSDGNYLQIAPLSGSSPVRPAPATLSGLTPTATPKTPW
jgi:hypothetical protein